MNLKKETIDMLSAHGKTQSDVKWAGCYSFSIPLSLFWELADQEYDDDYGAPEVAQDLIVVGNDFWLERHEYDGSEWWEYKELYRMPEKEINVKKIIAQKTGECWSTLAELNGINEED